ncbi:MAG: quinolinate synthase NadA [Candidatus Thermoplasmatota archaeon]|nr:quinolinate synthase NadA [Candidatus Thermoplasmatota archaeon]
MDVMSAVQRRIRDLAMEKDVLILAHNYQVPEVQDIADIVGDSLVLALKARDSKMSNILLAGVDFMAETAKTVNPQRRVIHPVPGATCPMANMIDVDSLADLRKRHPNAPVVAYVNTTAEVKAVSDVCCTSANAVQVVSSLDEEEVIFIPDSNLGQYVQSMLPGKRIVIWPGHCHVHTGITVDDIKRLKAAHPGSRTVVHPECPMDVIEISDRVASTEGMLKYALEDGSIEFIVGTEEGLVHRMRKEIPGKIFHPISGAVCPNMKKIGLEDILRSLETMSPTVEMDDEVIDGNRRCLERMFEAL